MLTFFVDGPKVDRPGCHTQDYDARDKVENAPKWLDLGKGLSDKPDNKQEKKFFNVFMTACV